MPQQINKTQILWQKDSEVEGVEKPGISYSLDMLIGVLCLQQEFGETRAAVPFIWVVL